MKVDTSIALKAGVIGAVAGIVFAVLTNVTPFLACVVCWVGPVIGLVTGALYVHFAGKVEPGEGALGGALSGGIGGAGSGIVSGIFSLLGAGAGAASSLLGGEGGGLQRQQQAAVSSAFSPPLSAASSVALSWAQLAAWSTPSSRASRSQHSSVESAGAGRSHPGVFLAPPRRLGCRLDGCPPFSLCYNTLRRRDPTQR